MNLELIKLLERREQISQSSMRLMTTAPEHKRSLEEKRRLLEWKSESAAIEESLYYRAFMHYLRNGERQVPDYLRPFLTEERCYKTDDAEKRDLAGNNQSAYPGATTGFFVPTKFATDVYGAMAETDTMWKCGSTVVDTTTGAPWAFPSDNDTTQTGERLTGEGAQVAIQDIGTTSLVMLKSFTYSSKLIKISNELLQDTGIDFEGYLKKRFSTRLAKTTNADLTNGAGNGNTPTGLATAASVGATAVGSSGNTGGPDGLNSIGSTDLENLIASVNPIYRQRDSCAFVLHNTTLEAIKKLTDKQGHPLRLFRSRWENSSGKDLLLDFPVYTNPDMPQLPSLSNSPPVATKTILFGDMSQFIIRRSGFRVAWLMYEFIDYDQRAAVAFVRCDSNLLDGGGGAVKALETLY